MRGSANASRSRAWFFALVVLAFLLRVAVIVNTRESVLFADMQEYHQRARHLIETGMLTPDAFRVPLFPIVIAGVLSVSGQQLIAVRLVQAALGALTVALTYVLARRLTTERGARAAALVVAVYPALVLYASYLMAETLFATLAILGVVLWADQRRLAALAAGLAIGGAVLTRSTGLAVLGGIVLTQAWTAVRSGHVASATLTRLALLALGVAIALSPWVLRNYAMYQRFIPTDTSSGFNALLGNYDGATGRHPGLAAVDAVAQEYWRDARTDVERSDIGLRVAREFVADEPARAGRLAVLKVAYLFGVEGREHAWGYSHHVQGRQTARTVWFWGVGIILSFPIVMALASIGAARPGLSQSPAGVLLAGILIAVTLIHVASFGDSRFHLPWIPLLAILAARAFAPLHARPWTATRQTLLAVWLFAWILVWRGQAAELLDVLPQLAESPTPLQLPF